MTNGGAIPDQFDYEVVLTPEGVRVGTLNEDFAFESMPGDIFQLGNTSYRILKVEQGKVHVEDARGEPPNLPFWIGEAPGRTDELSVAVSRLRADLDAQLEKGMGAGVAWVVEEYGVPQVAAEQLVHYLAGARAAFRADTNARADRFRALFSTRPVTCTSSSTRRTDRESTALGGSRCENGFAGDSTSSCKPPP